MNYIASIKTAMLVFPLIALLFWIPFVLHQYHKYGSINAFRVLIIYSFILYLITIYFLVILPLPNIKTMVKPTENMIRLIPFGFIGDIVRQTSFVLTEPSTYLNALKDPCIYTVVFNIFMTIPFGMYISYYFKCNLKETVILSLILSLFFEITQLTRLYFIYPYQYRVFDVDDLIMNTMGGTLGYYIMNLIKRFLPTRDEIDEMSLEAGKIVSGFRRITLFCLDYFLYASITIFISIFIKNNNIKYITFIIYYILIPYILNGITLGSKFLNIKLEYQNHRLIRSISRILFIYIYYLYIPYKLFFIATLIKNYWSLNSAKTIILFIFSFVTVLIFYIVNLVHIIRKKTIYYDKIFKVEYKNTITKGEMKNEIY